MDQLVRLNAQTAGRDKIARVIQYASKFLWNELQRTSSNQFAIEKLQILESTCSSFRKLLRFGRCTDSIYSSLSFINYPDIVIRITITLGKIANSLFLLSDHIVWLSRTGLLKNVDSSKWIQISNKYWLLNLIMNLIRDFYEITMLLSNEKVIAHFKMEFIRKPLNFQLYMTTFKKIYDVLKIRQDIFIDTLKNFCDLWIPLTGLQKVKLQPSIVGLLGTISSLAALVALLKPAAKLFPM